MDVKMEFETEELQTHEDGEWLHSNNSEQPVNIKDEIEIGDTLIVDGNEFVTKTEVEIDTETELSPLERMLAESNASTSGKPKKIQCKFCDYDASYPYRMKDHINAVHLGLKPYQCNQCDFSSSKASNLKSHIKCVHQKVKDFKCEQCDYSSTRSSDLKRHISSIHEKNRGTNKS